MCNRLQVAMDFDEVEDTTCTRIVGIGSQFGKCFST